MRRPVRVGLVLGAGGLTGLAYHAGALAALANDAGWDARDADLIVGTSAGSMTGALLRRGVAPLDLAAVACGGQALETPRRLVERLADRPELPPLRLRSMLGRPRLPSPALVARWARTPWRLDPVSALATLVPDGELDLAVHQDEWREVLGDGPVDDDLWICTVRQRDLRRRLFSRDGVVPLVDAVAASCAVPGYFSPVRIDGDAHIDGGVHSPTNADVLARCDLDLAVVISPMSGRDLPRLGLGAAVRRHARGRLEHELARLEAAGIPTVALEPGPEVAELTGFDMMADRDLAAIVGAAFIDVGEQLAAPVTRTLLAALTPSTPSATPADPAAEQPASLAAQASLAAPALLAAQASLAAPAHPSPPVTSEVALT